MIGFKIFRAIMKVFMKCYFRYYVKGKENIPKKGPIILASNHVAFIDSPLIASACPREIHFIGKSEYFRTDTLKHRFVATFFKAMHVIPVDRSGGKSAQASLDIGINELKKGNVFCIYPEGTRSPDAILYKGHTGIARVALATGVDIIPSAMIDTWIANPLGGGMKPIKCGVVFGERISIQPYMGKEVTHELLREITDKIMEALATLSGQEYNPDIYGSVRRAESSFQAYK
jgi:1-acyl-sn-glycerol-3-phosphate acyltransferase